MSAQSEAGRGWLNAYGTCSVLDLNSHVSHERGNPDLLVGEGLLEYDQYGWFRPVEGHTWDSLAVLMALRHG